MKSRPLIERFEEKVMPEPNTGCWIWTGAIGIFGYGIFQSASFKTTTAHRVSYSLYVGPIPKGAYICHTCDNSFCVNPQHLFAGSQLDNMRDKMSKGRHVAWKSEHCNLSKLSVEQVLKIRDLSSQGLNNNQISKIIGITRPNVSHIVNRKTWKKI